MNTLQQDAWSKGYRQGKAEQEAEIERVRAENVSLRDGNNEMVDHNAVLSAENERLREALRVLRADRRCMMQLLSDSAKETEE